MFFRPKLDFVRIRTHETMNWCLDWYRALHYVDTTALKQWAEFWTVRVLEHAIEPKLELLLINGMACIWDSRRGLRAYHLTVLHIRSERRASKPMYVF